MLRKSEGVANLLLSSSGSTRQIISRLHFVRFFIGLSSCYADKTVNVSDITTLLSDIKVQLSDIVLNCADISLKLSDINEQTVSN